MFSQKQVEFKEDDLRRPLHIFFFNIHEEERYLELALGIYKLKFIIPRYWIVYVFFPKMNFYCKVCL